MTAVTLVRVVAGLGAVVATAGLVALRTGLLGPPAVASPDDLVPALVAIGLLCVLGLVRRDRPTAAWLATIGAIAIVTIDLAAHARVVALRVDDPTWTWLAIGICLAALLGTATSAAYAATRPPLPRPWAAIAGGIGVFAITVGSVWAVANAPDPAVAVAGASPLGSLRLVTRSFLVVVPLLTAAGLIGDALPAARRARQRAAGARASAGSIRDTGAQLAAWSRAFADEVAPGRSRARRAVLDERSRVARDLHADVVPVVRQALAEAERGVPADRLALTLRRALAEVEAVGAAQNPIQLEVGGLVPALEWLAERTEERSDVVVTVEVAEPLGGRDGRLPPDVAAAAFRVARLALDNVVRHAPSSSATVRVAETGEALELDIADDGPGASPGALAAAVTNGRRGVADMTTEAAACGAELRVGRAPHGTGTVVHFSWSGPGANR